MRSGMWEFATAENLNPAQAEILQLLQGRLIEIMAHVALNLFTNYVNVAFKVPVDFPAVKLRAK